MQGPKDAIEDRLLRNIQKLNKKCTVTQIKQESGKYFYLKPTDKVEYVHSRLLHMKPLFLDALGISEFESVTHQSIKPFYTFGVISSATGTKIGSDGVETGGSVPSPLLFNTTDNSNVPVKLDLSALDSYSLFNGQVVAVKGTNTRGDILLVESLYATPTLNINLNARESFEIIVCKGPFSPILFETIFKQESGVFILMGPFCSSDGDCFRSFSKFTEILEISASKLDKPQIYLVPNLEDGCTIGVFPQPPMKIQSNRVTMMPNPACFFLNNHVLLLSNFDGFIDLCYEEVAKEPSRPGDLLFSGDRMQRLSCHLVFQQSLVPVLNSKSNVAYGSWLNISYAPDLYIISSKMKIFERMAGPTTVFNAGGTVSGVFKIIGNITNKGGSPQYRIENMKIT